jgi:hypothetical protein
MSRLAHFLHNQLTGGSEVVSLMRQLPFSPRKKKKLGCDQRSVGQFVLVLGSHLELMTKFFLFCLTTAGFLMFGTSLTRGWVCNLLVQLLLGLARALALRSKSCRTHDYILLSHLRFPQPGGPGSRIYIPRNRVPQIPVTYLC